ncbi:DNA cytosine methyltransferase [Blastococcus sp. SYSU D00820]
MLSLFSGAGGLDLGAEAAGFTVIGCVEKDTKCIATLRRNRVASDIEMSDVTVAVSHLTPARFGIGVGDLDLIAGGPPCQPFSTAAQWHVQGKRGMRDRRAETIISMLDLVERFLPRALLIENVAGFLHGSVSAKPFIADRLDQINARHGTSYDLKADVVNAADYGVPQNRRRVIGIALRDGATITLPQKTHDANPTSSWDAIWDLAKEPGPLPSLGRWGALLPSIPEGENYQYLTNRGGGQEVFGYRTRYWSFLLKLAKDRPSWTLPASPGPSTGPFHWDNRALSVRERMRLQTFPDTWELVGTLSDQIRQVGNATPPLLAEVVCQSIADTLGIQRDDRELTFAIARAATPPSPPECPSPIPSEFSRWIGPKSAHPGTGKGPGRLLVDEGSTDHEVARR